MTNPQAYFGLPAQVHFCRRCVMSNQRPTSVPEFRHSPDLAHGTMNIDAAGICDACRFADQKEKIDWSDREQQLVKLLDRYRSQDGSFDCLVPGSGGKDSCYAAYLLKYKYGMHPLTCTWPPSLYTDIGFRNFRSWIDVGGFDNVTFNWNGRVHRLLTGLAVRNLLHPFQTFILGQKNLAPKIAARFDIPLVFYGENEAEYGNPIADNNQSLRDHSFHTMTDINQVWLGGVRVPQLLEQHGLTLNDLMAYLPLDFKAFEQKQIQIHYLGYYVKWTPQEAFYSAVETCDFAANPVRTEGTYSKYNSLDDKIDGFHYYTTHIKFGLGRASYDASQEIRNRHLTREEGVSLAQQFDGEFPARFADDVMAYIGMSREEFHRLCDRFRSPHLWHHEDGAWRLRQPVWDGNAAGLAEQATRV
jgi:N-acetyl sugar amidotransferase